MFNMGAGVIEMSNMPALLLTPTGSSIIPKGAAVEPKEIAFVFDYACPV